MKMITNLLITISLCVSTFVFFSCTNDEEPQLPEPEVMEEVVPEEEPKVEEPQSRGAVPIAFAGNERAINNRLNDFAWRLFSEAYAQKKAKDNILLSPLSLEIALGMFQNGLVPEDQQEMLKTMGLEDYTAEDVNAYFKRMIAGIVEADDLATLEIANALWYKDGYKIKTDFQMALEDSFEAKVQDAPFDNTTIDAINEWCAEKTHDLITEIVSIDFSPDVFALLNAVYFKAGWERPFDKEKTEDMPFHYADGTTANIPMMQKLPLLENSNETFYYLDNSDYQAIALPFKNDAFKWFAFLPQENKNIADILPLISSETLSNLTKYKGGLSGVTIPKYEISYTVGNLVSLIDALNPDLYFKLLDFQSAFDTQLPVDMEIDALQKTFFKIDEVGAEAAAVTAVVGVASVPPSITLDRPFIYGIMETSSGCPLFIGYYGDNPK